MTYDPERFGPQFRDMQPEWHNTQRERDLAACRRAIGDALKTPARKEMITRLELSVLHSFAQGASWADIKRSYGFGSLREITMVLEQDCRLIGVTNFPHVSL